MVDENAAKLSNFEVFQLLRDIESGTNGQKKPNKAQQNLATISYSTLKYLEKTPCAHQSEEVLAAFMKAVQPFKLTKAEKLLLLNHRPLTAVEIQLMVEESEERLTEDDIDKLLTIVLETLPASQTDGENQDVEMKE